MEVSFELVPEDLWQWNRYYRHNLQFMRPMFLVAWRATLGLVLSLLLLLICVGLLRHQPVTLTSYFYALAAAWLFYKYFPLSKKRTVAFYARDPNQFCRHTIKISPEWIEEATPLSRTKMSWLRLTSLEENEHYFYFCIKGSGAFITPKHAFCSLIEAQTFLEKSRLYWNAAKTGDDPGVWPPPPRPI